jgi:alkaline phosphatase D
MTTSRRAFLSRSGLALAALPLARGLLACDASADAPTLPEYAHDGPEGPDGLFAHGVASGDPLPDRVILWTRVSTPREAVPVFWEVARDAAFTDRVAAGWTEAVAARDHCVKVDAAGLPPATRLHYRFRVEGRASPVGRTRTAAPEGLAPVRVAVCSCANLTVAPFHAYRELAARDDLDAIVHLGDYLYEYGTSPDADRPAEPTHALRTAADYLQRHAQYKRDPDLQEAHRQHPWIAIWDDHETLNDAHADGADEHDPAQDGPWGDRKAAATRAWWLWMPTRELPEGRLDRALRFGGVVDLLMVDTRLAGRDPQLAIGAPEAEAEDRQLLGAAQEARLFGELAASRAIWTVLGQQVMVAPLRLGGVAINVDQWDGYPAARRRLYEAVLAAPALRNFTVLTGDIHSSWANELRDDAGAPVGVELVAPGVTSSGLGDTADQFIAQLRDELPHVRWVDLSRRGYLVASFSPSHLEASWHLFDDLSDPAVASAVGAIWRVEAGARVFSEVGSGGA